MKGQTSGEAPRRAVVIGSGFGGLAMAVRLQAAGVQTTLLEKRERIGGRAYQLKDRGYTFDMGPSLITAPAIIDSVFRAAGRSFTDYVELVPLDPYYRIYFHDGTFVDYSGDPERMKAQMRAFNPRDAERYDDFMAAIRPIFDAVIGDRLGSKPFDTLSGFAAFLPQLVKLNAWMPSAWFVNRFFQDWRHRFMYSFHPLFLGGNPFTAPAIYLMIPYLERLGGVWFSTGGMYSVVEALGKLFQEIGGTIRTEAEVTRIRVSGGQTTGVDVGDEHLPADLVVSNADIAHLYGTLLKETPRRRWTEKRLEKLDYTMSCFLLYLGTRKQYPQLEHHTLILAERYRELLVDIFDRKVLPDDFSMYLHVPTRTDPGMAPEGCESMYVLVPVANNASGIDWEAEKDRYAAKIIDFLEAWGMEGLKEHLEVLHVMTPDDFQSELNAHLGNAFAVEPKVTQTAWFRPHNRSEEIPNLYLVGAGTHPGAGVPGVFLSAEATYGCVARDFGLEPAWDSGRKGEVVLGVPSPAPSARAGKQSAPAVASD
jgi:phytoene desaturase